ncbi:nodulation protein NfeD, partial [Vibrio parahaemolyticus]|nr:nodulation protein NfeD [Vibrio parahaemolyticus]
PVAIGGAPQAPSSDDGKDKEASDENKPNAEKSGDQVQAKTAMEKKVINDAKAYIKGLAKLHDRKAQCGEKAVSVAGSLVALVSFEFFVFVVIYMWPVLLV